MYKDLKKPLFLKKYIDVALLELNYSQQGEEK